MVIDLFCKFVKGVDLVSNVTEKKMSSLNQVSFA